MGFPVVTLADSNGFAVSGTSTAVIAAGVGTTVIKATPGRLGRVSVTTASTTGVLTIYDNASTGSGTVLAAIPTNAAIGTSFDFQMPAANGITAVGAANSAGVTVSYS